MVSKRSCIDRRVGATTRRTRRTTHHPPGEFTCITSTPDDLMSFLYCFGHVKLLSSKVACRNAPNEERVQGPLLQCTTYEIVRAPRYNLRTTHSGERRPSLHFHLPSHIPFTFYSSGRRCHTLSRWRWPVAVAAAAAAAAIFSRPCSAI